MKKLIITCIVFTVILTVSGRTYTQFSHYSVKEGLSEINVLCMLQDQKGQMWFGTFDGLNKFNGYSFKTYKTNPGQLSGLENYRVDMIKEDKAGFLWIQTYDGRVYRFDPRTEKFLQVPQCKEEFKSNKLYIVDIYTFADGSVWLSSLGDGCFRIKNLAENDDVQISHFNEGNELLSSNKINNIFQDSHKNTWVLTDDGLNIFKQDTQKPQQLFVEKAGGAFYSITESGNFIWIGGEHGKIRMYNTKKETFDGITSPCKSSVIDIKTLNNNQLFVLSNLSGFFLYDIHQHKFTAFTKSNGSGVISDVFYSCYMDKKQNIWLETENPSVVYFQTKEQKVNNFYKKTANSSQFAPSVNFFVIEDKYENIWVHPRLGGFSWYNKALNSLEAFHNDPDSPDRRFSNTMHSAFSDKQGNLWLCPYSHGIEKVVFSESPFSFCKPKPAEMTSASNEIRSIFQDKENRIWIGAKNGSITVFDQNHKPIGELCKDGRISASNALKASIYAFCSDNNGTIWLGSKGNGLYKLENTGTAASPRYKITNFRYNPNDIYSLSSNNVYSILQDHLHQIWIATYGGGINLLKQENGNTQFISARNKLKNYPMSQCNRARCLTEDARGKIYVGTTGGMVVFKNSAIRPENISFSLYTHDPTNPKTISGNDVHNILSARNGKLYLAIFGGGLDVLNEELDLHKKPEFKSYMVGNGIPSNVVYTLKEDPKGNIWFSTQTEIGIFIPVEERFDTYQPFNDKAYSFTEASVCQTRQGDLAYGTTEGFVIFNPLKATKSEYKPRIVLTNFQLFNKTIEVGVNGSPLKHVIDETSELKLNHKQNIFSIGFAALDYTNPQNIQYAYKLDGFEKEWNYVQYQRIATYTNLPKGKYVFRVKSTNAEGVWVENERNIQIEKLPSFWESNWGYLFYFLVFIGLAALTVYILSTIYRLKTDVEVEHRITNLKLRFFTDVSHELRTPLTLIASPVENILRTESLSENAKEQLTMVQRNTDRMLRLITQILDFRKIQNKKMKLLAEAIQPGSTMKEISVNFNKMAEERNIDFRIIDESNNATIWADKDKFEKIFYNLLSNAFKFTQPGNPIEVTISENQDTVCVSVKDKGVGMSKDRVKLLFNRFESLASTNVSFQQGTGIGLSLTKELAELHHARIEVESEPGKGSTFKVTFLKGNKHFSGDEEYITFEETQPETDESTGNEYENSETDILETKRSTEKQTILIVEDNKELRAFLRTVLIGKYDILEAENGRQALEIARKEIPDIIITDVMMPEMNGMELTKAIKEDIIISHIPLVLLTAKTDMENKLEALEYGVDDYITKPFSSAYLEARIENLLKLRKQLQEVYRSSLTSGVLTRSKPNLVSQDDIFIQRIMTYIENNIENSEMTIDEIASHIALGRTTFFKKLKSLTGLSPIEFLSDIRIQRAARLIETGEYNFSEITYMVGISDPRYFSRVFKQKFGVSPRDYKDRCREKEKE
jgi:signal transduction histidine kinase/DNA-binding response OmpR family regulator/ligand-binding sensor domain-containing protein